MAKRTILIIVPGKDDRAFYKSYISKILGSNSDINVIDLDSENNSQEKNNVLQNIFPYNENIPSFNYYPKGIASLHVIRKNGSDVYIFIIPSGISVTQKACTILQYLDGIESDNIIVDTMIIAEDAEDETFREKLENLCNSLISNNCININRELSSGEYYMYYSLNKPRGMKLLFVIQGLAHVDILGKHAIEDFVIYPFLEELREKLVNICENIIGDLNNPNTYRRLHKKLALLIALSKCNTSIEEFFHRTLNENEMNILRRNHDGLKIIIEIILDLINTSAS